VTSLEALAAEYADRPDVLVTVDSDDLRWQGFASLIPLLVPIDSAEAHPRNPRRGQLDVIAGSLSDFGQTKAIVVQASTRWIVAGNHTRRAAMERLGWTHIAAVVADLSEEDASSYLVMDNRSSDLGEYDTSGLVALLEEAAEDGRIASTGYSPDDLDDLIALNERSATAGRDEFEAGLNDDDEGGGERPGPQREPGVREVVLLYSDDQHQQFSGWVRALMREFGTDSQSEAVYEAVKRAARDA
jgi:ParB-like chromosome segregation protein Spo0J